jgi:hypothetical protein
MLGIALIFSDNTKSISLEKYRREAEKKKKKRGQRDVLQAPAQKHMGLTF